MKIPRVKIYLKFNIILKALFSNYKKSKLELSNKLKKNLNKEYIEFFGMCRTGFIVILEYIKRKLPHKNEIIICSYNLEEMVDIAKLYKFNVRLVDIRQEDGVVDINLIKNNSNEKTAAILYTNMFNDYNQIEEIKKFCNSKSIILIEDCAIYFRNFHNQEAKRIYSGSYGDVSILSFGIMKNVSAIFGGALLTSNEDIYNFSKEKFHEYKNFPKNLYFKKFVLFLLLKFFLSKYIYNLLFFHVIKISTKKKIKFLLNLIYPSLKFKPKKEIPNDYYSKISNLSLKIVNHTLDDKTFEQDEIKRKENNALYFRLLSTNENIQLVKIKDYNFQNFLDFPIIVKNKEKLANYLFKQGLETRIHFYSNCEKYYNEQNNINSQYYDQNLICLPSHSEVTNEKIKNYCEEIKNFYIYDRNTNNKI